MAVSKRNNFEILIDYAEGFIMHYICTNEMRLDERLYRRLGERCPEGSLRVTDTSSKQKYSIRRTVPHGAFSASIKRGSIQRVPPERPLFRFGA
jgi:hypothetical protein